MEEKMAFMDFRIKEPAWIKDMVALLAYYSVCVLFSPHWENKAHTS